MPTTSRQRKSGLRWLRRICLLLVQVAIALVLLEIGARLLDPLGISYFPETARFFDTMIHEEPIGYRLQPSLNASFHHAKYSINSLGFRGAEVVTPKPTGEKRIMWLGDSVVFSIGVDDERTIPAVLQRQANGGRDEGRYRVLNMGVPSYNTEQELIQLETLGPTLDPDAVILMFAVNDIEAKKWVFAKRASWTADFAQRSYALSTLYILSRLARSGIGAEEKLVNVQNFQENNPRWRAITDSMSAIRRYCSERSIPFVVFVMGSADDPPYNMLAAEGRRAGFDVIGLEPIKDARWPDAFSPRYRNSMVDAHCSVAGCEMWGTLVYDELVRRGIIER